MQHYIQNQSEHGVTHIKIAEGLTEFPIALFKYAATLEILDLSNNKLSILPRTFSQFKKLKVLFCTNNTFEVFPEVLAECPELSMISFKSNKMQYIPENAFPKKLRWLILTDNLLTSIPESIGTAKWLQKCALAGNQLTTIPDTISNCMSLELLRISANSLTVFPSQLLKLPRLAWLGFSGNPFVKKLDIPLTSPFFDWNDFEIEHVLGEGASGIISKAYWKSKQKNVAIKIFKGDVTSDGYPEDELHACLATGTHSNLVPLIGQIQNHPENKSGIVMELISPEYQNLGNPPSLESCSRDVFPEDLGLNSIQAITILKSVASSAYHLHQNGILHGDLYTHNTLYHKNGHAYFGDFGAASFYDKNEPNAPLIERIDVRSFGYFMEDVLNVTKSENSVSILEIKQLMHDCLLSDVALRPDFNTILEKLSDV